MRSEFIHRDKLSGSTATTFQRLQQAIRRSNSRALRIGSRARAFSTNSTAATSRLLYDFTTPLESDQFQPEYLMQLQLGTPVTTFHAIADTGSDLVWVQCLPCLQCYKTNDSIFDPSNSSSYSQISCSSQACQALGSNQLPACSNGSSCPYLYEYGDKSVTIGDLSNDTVTMNTTTGVSVSLPIAFGCGHNNSGISFSNDSGGMGLGRGPLSLISQLSSVLVQEQFSYCMVAFEVSIKTNSPVLFGSAAALSGLDILTTPILDGPIPSFYYVGITGIDVGGSPLQITGSSFNSSSAGTIFDSGTSLTYLEANAYAIVKSTFASLIPPHCWRP
ncbi:hypothetical protein O6H91_21G046700 [Diphasiastrum complanatum]|uniref:Uncharacterized protein n=1 Tax=Diphasiastrum complanatum TaxID=34168 RepID=A0ACC2AK69_DIPCM|nr:hypothetical protein O6H91_21G046700 [Diphasiastrum complanatum]